MKPKASSFTGSTGSTDSTGSTGSTALTASVNTTEFVELGVLGRAHGLKGEVFLKYYAESLEWLSGPLWLRSGPFAKPYPAKTASFRLQNNNVLVLFEHVKDRSAAETLRGLSLLMPAKDLPKSLGDNLYLHDLLGLNVVLHSSSEHIGVLEHVDFVGEQELWSITSPEGQEILFPAVPEFVDGVDFDKGEIRVSPPLGLLELYVGDA